jgi:hypothetical protein
MTQSGILKLMALAMRFEFDRDSMPPVQLMALHALLVEAEERDAAKLVETFFNEKVEASRREAARIALLN